MGLKNYSSDIFRDINKDIIIISLEDVKIFPELSKYIPLETIIEQGFIYLKDLDFETQIKVIKDYLKRYDFIEYILQETVFNFTKLKNLWKDNDYLDFIFASKKVFFETTIKNEITGKEETYKYYLLDDISTQELNYIGILFFISYSKIKKETNFVIKEYESFTDVHFENNNFTMYKDLKEFFLQEFFNFINIGYGDVFGSYNFGSNLKYLIQSKNLKKFHDESLNDIKGFISDMNVLYGEFIEILDLYIEDQDYELIIHLKLKIEDELLHYRFVKNY